MVIFKVPMETTVCGLILFCFKESHWTEKFGLSDILSGLYSGDARPNLFPDTNSTEIFRGFLKFFEADYT